MNTIIELIEVYKVKNKATQNSLRWYVAQQRAMANDYPSVILSARQVLLEEDFALQPLRWNAYVLATIAFMQVNKEALMLIHISFNNKYYLR